MDSLVKTAVDGAVAFGELAKLYRPALLRAATRTVGEADAEDAVQEALCDAMVGMGKFDESKGRVKAWFMGYVKKECEKILRERRSIPTVALDEALEMMGEDPMEILGANEVAEEVRAAIAKLPGGQREAFEMYADGKCAKEIAQIMGTTEMSVNMRIHKAKVKLRKELFSLCG